MWGRKGNSCQGTCIKDTWTKPKGGRIEGGAGGVMGRKWRQWYLNNNKKYKRKNSNFTVEKSDRERCN